MVMVSGIVAWEVFTKELAVAYSGSARAINMYNIPIMVKLSYFDNETCFVPFVGHVPVSFWTCMLSQTISGVRV